LSATKSRSSLEIKSPNVESSLISTPHSTYFKVENFYVDFFHKYHLYKYLKLKTSIVKSEIEANKQLIKGLTNSNESLTKELKTLKDGIISNPELQKTKQNKKTHKTKCYNHYNSSYHHYHDNGYHDS
jgi:regulator of replication initiation timing